MSRLLCLLDLALNPACGSWISSVLQGGVQVFYPKECLMQSIGVLNRFTVNIDFLNWGRLLMCLQLLELCSFVHYFSHLLMLILQLNVLLVYFLRLQLDVILFFQF